MRGQKAKSGHKLNTAAKKHRELYKLHGNYIKNKLKRIYRSNGVKAAKRRAASHGMLIWLRGQPWYREVKQ